MKKSPSPAATPSPIQQQALATSQQQQQLQQGQIGAAGQTIAQAQQPLTAITQRDATGQTALRRALTTTGTQATNQAYNNAAAASRLRGLGAGLANQPMELGNERALEGQRASALGQIPFQVEQQAAPLELQASGLENQLANTQLGAARIYNPESYFGTGASMEEQRQQALNQQYLEAQRQRGGLFGGLARIGLGMIPGIGGALSGALGGAGGTMANGPGY